MKVKVKLNRLRIAPRKVRLAASLIKEKKAKDALNLLKFSTKKAAHSLEKLVRSGMADAEHNFQLNPDDLRIFEIRVDEGATLKRWRARARGRAGEIHKKTSHITLVLEGEKKKSFSSEERKPLKLEEQVERGKKKGRDEIKKPQKTIIPTKKTDRRGGIFRRKAI